MKDFIAKKNPNEGITMEGGIVSEVLPLSYKEKIHGLLNPGKALNRFVFGKFYKRPLKEVLSGDVDNQNQDGMIVSRGDYLGESIEANKTYNILSREGNSTYKIQSLSKEKLDELKNEYFILNNFDLDQGLNIFALKEQERFVNFMRKYIKQSCQYFRFIGLKIGARSFHEASNWDGDGKPITDLNKLSNGESYGAVCVEANIVLAQLLEKFYDIKTTFQQVGPHPFLADEDGRCYDLVKGPLRICKDKQVLFALMARKGFGIQLDKEKNDN